jgi:hypothetical protein
VKSKIYEARLEGYGKTFIKHREDLMYQLSIHTALGVDMANKKLDTTNDHMEAMNKKFDDFMKMFQKLETPRERDARLYMEQKGGAEKCIANDQTLLELIEKSGEGVEGVTGGTRGDSDKALAAAKKALNKELAENLDEALKKNFKLFEKKLQMQSKQLDKIEDSIHASESSIISTFLSGAHDRIEDEVGNRQFTVSTSDAFLHIGS